AGTVIVVPLRCPVAGEPRVTFQVVELAFELTVIVSLSTVIVKGNVAGKALLSATDTVVDVPFGLLTVAPLLWTAAVPRVALYARPPPSLVTENVSESMVTLKGKLVGYVALEATLMVAVEPAG